MTLPASPGRSGSGSASNSRTQRSTPSRPAPSCCACRVGSSLSSKAVTRRLAELSELIELGDALDRQIGTYSGGMQRRLDLAAALVHNPQILFLDEHNRAGSSEPGPGLVGDPPAESAARHDHLPDDAVPRRG